DPALGGDPAFDVRLEAPEVLLQHLTGSASRRAAASPATPPGGTYCSVTVISVCFEGSSLKVTWPLVLTALSSVLRHAMRLPGSSRVVTASHSTSWPIGPFATQRVVLSPSPDRACSSSVRRGV